MLDECAAIALHQTSIPILHDNYILPRASRERVPHIGGPLLTNFGQIRAELGRTRPSVAPTGAPGSTK